MKDAQRILFLADINSIHTERWVKSLLKEGFAISLFSLSQKTTDWANELNNFQYQCFGITHEEIRSNKRFGKASYFSAKKEAKRYFLSVRPDIVHAHYASSYGTLARQIGHERTVLSLWGSDVYEFPKRSPIHRFLFKKAVKFAKIVCSTSSDMATEASKYVKREYVITPFGVDMKRFVPSKIQTLDEMTTIGTVKSLEDVYGIDRLIQTYAIFRQKTETPSRLRIFGDGSQKEALQKLTEKLKISEHVSFEGFVSNEDLVKAFQSLDVFVALSRRESFGVAALESQACGTPVLVSNVGGLPEVTCSETGRIVNEGDEENWAKELIELTMEARNTRQKDLARKFVEENFSHEVCVQRLIEVYRNV